MESGVRWKVGWKKVKVGRRWVEGSLKKMKKLEDGMRKRLKKEDFNENGKWKKRR